MSNDDPSDADGTTSTRISIVVPPSWRRGQTDVGDCLVIIYAGSSNQLGRRYTLHNEFGACTIGRAADNTIQLDEDSVSRRHCRVEPRDDGWVVVDERSTNGTFVNDQPVAAERPLGRGDLLRVGDTIFKFLAGSDVEAAYYEEIYRMTIVDGLTGAHNKRFLMEQVEKEISRSRRYGRPLTLAMMDLDHFKSVNDTHGHLAGDAVLREVAGLVHARIRRDEVFARYGGEEFALLVPETAPADAARLAEALRARIEAHAVMFDGKPLRVTCSFGLAALTDSVQSAEDFVRVADARLYEAKSAGRNRVVY